MKGMMADFDTNMDFSGYIEDGELFEFKKAIDGVEHLCTAFKTDYGAVYIYTLDGTLRYIDMYDAEGLRQMHMTVNVFLPQVLNNVRVKSKKECMEDPDVLAEDAKVKELLGDSGRTLLRESGTEPVIRVMVEAGSDETCEKLVDSVIDVIEEKGHIV
jgi:phosphomannomutase